MLDSLSCSNPVGDLAERSDYTEREVLKLMDRAGFRDVHSALMAPHVLDGWAFSRAPGYRKIDAATKAGYKTREGLRAAFRVMLGKRSIDEAAEMSGEEVVDTLAQRVIGPRR
jgi:hypothetical protein